MCYANLMSAATTIPYEFRREVSPGRAAIPEAASRLLDLHHQYRPESSGSGLRRRWMQVHQIQLFGHRHEARLDADASRKTDTLSRGIASDCGHTLHHDLFRRSVIKFHRKSINYRSTAVLQMYCHRIKNKEYEKKRKITRGVKEKCNSTWTCSLFLSTRNVNCHCWTE